MPEVLQQPLVRDEEGALTREYVGAVKEAIGDVDGTHMRELVVELHESDLADLLEILKSDERQALISELGDDFKFMALSELHEQVRDEVVDALPNEQLAEAVRELESDDALYLLEDMEESERTDILAKIPAIERQALRRSLDYGEDSAGRLMQTEFIAIPPFWSVGQAIDHLREDKGLPANFSEIFVVTPSYHLRGAIGLSTFLRAGRDTLIRDIMDEDRHKINVEKDQEEVARTFERYDLMSAPVVDRNDRIVGVITVDDIVEVIQEEAEEDIHRMGGVGQEFLSDAVLRTTKNRFAWLFINLVTSIMASMVIQLFDATIEQMVALAVLMPIVASMGGNAATQTMTVAVRALATRDLGSVNAGRVITREMLVGVLNGLSFATIMGLVTLYWFESPKLGLVIGFAMAFNMIIAGLSGILVPLTLDRYKIDPAIASTVFVTTVTDIFGFFIFLGLAALWLM